MVLTRGGITTGMGARTGGGRTGGACLKGRRTAKGRAARSFDGPTSSTRRLHLLRVAASAAALRDHPDHLSFTEGVGLPGILTLQRRDREHLLLLLFFWLNASGDVLRGGRGGDHLGDGRGGAAVLGGVKAQPLHPLLSLPVHSSSGSRRW